MRGADIDNFRTAQTDNTRANNSHSGPVHREPPQRICAHRATAYAANRRGSADSSARHLADAPVGQSTELPYTPRGVFTPGTWLHLDPNSRRYPFMPHDVSLQSSRLPRAIAKVSDVAQLDLEHCHSCVMHEHTVP